MSNEDRMILRQLADAGFIPDNVIDKIDEIAKKIVEFLTHADLSNQCYCLTQLEADWVTDNYAYFETVINEFTGLPVHIKVGSLPWFMGYGNKILLFDELQFKPYLQRKDE